MDVTSTRRFWAHTLASVQFLSRLPVHRIATDDGPINFSASAYTFPIAGLIVAFPAAVTMYIASLIWADTSIVAIATVIVQLLVSGALHEDGLADIADGFWGGATRERKLEIMRDSMIGTYGILALIGSILLRVAVLAHLLIRFDPLMTALLFLTFESLSRLAILWPWHSLSSAREIDDGEVKPSLSARYGGPASSDLWNAAVCALPALLIALFVAGLWPLLAGIWTGGLFVVLMTRMAKHHVGGHTGDVLGATQQLSLLGLYLGIAIAI